MTEFAIITFPLMIIITSKAFDSLGLAFDVSAFLYLIISHVVGLALVNIIWKGGRNIALIKSMEKASILSKPYNVHHQNNDLMFINQQLNEIGLQSENMNIFSVWDIELEHKKIKKSIKNLRSSYLT